MNILIQLMRARSHKYTKVETFAESFVLLQVQFSSNACLTPLNPKFDVAVLEKILTNGVLLFSPAYLLKYILNGERVNGMRYMFRKVFRYTAFLHYPFAPVFIFIRNLFVAGLFINGDLFLWGGDPQIDNFCQQGNEKSAFTDEFDLLL